MLGLWISIFCFEHTFLWDRCSGLEVFIGSFFSHFQGRFFAPTSSSAGFGNLDVGNSARIFTSFLFLLLRDFIGVGDGCFYWGRNFLFPIKKDWMRRMLGCM